MAPGADECPICGAQRLQAGPRETLAYWARPAGAVAIVAFALAVLLIRPWEKLTPQDLPSPNIALLPTATATPTRRPTLDRPATAATWVTPTEAVAMALTIPPTRTPAPTPVTPTPTRPPTYTVVAGDTASEIAARFGVTTADLMAANGLSLQALLRVGQELIIPTPQVEEGEEAEPATPTAEATPAPTEPPGPTDTPVPTEAPTATPPPTDTPAPTPTRRTEASTYVVEAGDTLSGIAYANGLTTAELVAANGLSANAVLSIGQELIIPVPQDEDEPEATATVAATSTPSGAPLVHVVASGETLGAIAVEYDVSTQEIAAANGISVNSLLSVGQELVIPGRYVGAPEATATPPPTETPAPTATSAPAPPEEAPTEAPASEDPVPEATETPAPAQIIHVVAQGDTLGSIAVKYDVAAERIAAANGISVNSLLRIGQELIIPDTSVTATPAATATATLSPTPSATLSPTATATRIPGFVYSRPRLLAPVGGATFDGRGVNVLMNWTSVGILAEDEWYVVRLWRSEGDAEPVIAWTKATSWRLPGDLHPAEGTSHAYRWQVNVMRRPLGAQTGVAISPSSEIYHFAWQ
jgi:LysM repeat protein